MGIGNMVELRAEAPFIMEHIGDFDAGAEVEGEA